MKRDGVKRLRQRMETSVLQRRSRWRLYAFGALSDYPCISRQRTASPWRGSYREGRSGEVAAGTERTLGYGVKAEGGFIAFCALSDTTAIATAGGLRFIMQGA